MPCRRSVWLTGLFCSCLGASALCAAAPAALASERFSVPDGCGSEAAFESEFERLTGTPAPEDVPDSLLIESLGREGYELRLVVRNEQRVLRDPDCRTLWRSALVISAAAIGLEARTREPPAAAPTPAAGSATPAATPPTAAAPSSAPPLQAQPTPSASAPGAPSAGAVTPSAQAPGEPSVTTTATPPDTPLPAQAVPRTRARRPSLARSKAARRARPQPPRSSNPPRAPEPAPAPPGEPSGVRYAVDLGAGVSGGVLPGVGAVLELGARVEAWPGAALLGLRYWPERSESRDGRGVDVSAVGVRAAAAFWVTRRVQVLGGAELNRLAGVGLESVSGRSADSAWQLAPTLGLSLNVWNNRHLRIELGGIGRASLLRPAFVVTGFGEVYRVPVFGADAIIRGVWLFP